MDEYYVIILAQRTLDVHSVRANPDPLYWPLSADERTLVWTLGKLT